MKPLFTLLLAALAFVATAQPQKIHYQGVAVGANGNPLKNSTVGLRLSVLDSLPTGTTIYTETQTASTDDGGLFSIYLGAGSATTGTFANLPWANGNDKFLKVEMDAQGGSNYQPMGTTQLVSVPYAMAAGTANVIEEGTLLKMKNGHVLRLEYQGYNGPVWTIVSGISPAIISEDTIYSCGNSVWVKGSKSKQFESPVWNCWNNTSKVASANDDSFLLQRSYGDTLFVLYGIIPNFIGYSNTDSAVIVFLPNTSSSAGADQLSLTGTTATLAANTPAAGETGAWSILSGSGGSLSSSTYPTATFTKGTDSAYTLVWTITGPCGTTTDTVNLLFQAQVGTACGQSVTYAGESYPTVQIGTQCWFAKNLNVGAMITWGSTPQINNGVIEKYCYGNDSTKCTIFGGLYVWAETVNYQNGASNTWYANPGLNNNVQGICPIGWHIPNSIEWNQMVIVLGGSGIAGGALKSSSILWIPSPYGGIVNNNSSGFSALPAGYFDGPFRALGEDTYFWASNEVTSNTAAGFNVTSIDHNVYLNSFMKYQGNSVRCLKD